MPSIRPAYGWPSTGATRDRGGGLRPDGVLAYPLTTVAAGRTEIADLALIAERAPIEVLVGLPRSLGGDEGPAAVKARERAAALAAAIAIPVRLVDERLTTVTARQRSGRVGRRPVSSPLIDAPAAGGHPRAGACGRTCRAERPGELVSPDRRSLIAAAWG